MLLCSIYHWFLRGVLVNIVIGMVCAYSMYSAIRVGNSATTTNYIPKSKRSWANKLNKQVSQLLKTTILRTWNRIFEPSIGPYRRRKRHHPRKSPQTISGESPTRTYRIQWWWCMLGYLMAYARTNTKNKRIHRLQQILQRHYVPPDPYGLLCQSAVAMSAENASDTEGETRSEVFDTDSGLVGIDNRASACMSDQLADFVGLLRPTNRVVKGFAGSRTTNIQVGTIRWRIEDDKGTVTSHTIPNSYYVPDGKVRLLSPQHWSRSMPICRRPQKGDAPESTYHNKVVLRWDQGRSIKTVPLDPSTNVATFSLAPDFHRFAAFCAEAEVNDTEENKHPWVMESEVVTDDEGDNDDTEVHEIPSVRQYNNPTFNLEGPMTPSRIHAPVVIEDEEERQVDNVSAEFLRYHHKFNHVSPKRIQLMAKQGVLPRRLATCPIPVCTACLYGKATKRKWRHKTAQNAERTHCPTRPGEVVSVDQMISPTAGLVAQIAGKPTVLRYTCATIFIDHFTDYSYVVIQKTVSAEETVQAKILFEQSAREQGVVVSRYHADNGVFKSHSWTNHCANKGQGLTFAGVNAHHQNGRAERRIRELQQMARTMLIHANRRWPEAINAHLWPYAIRMANDVLNATPSVKRTDGKSPSSIFDRTEVSTNPRHWQPFGCPTYVLTNAMQGSGIQNKWQERSRVGVYLGRSPNHAQSVALVLSLTTGLVSPQFHVKFDSAFQTMRTSFGTSLPKSMWQEKTGFIAKIPNQRILQSPTVTDEEFHLDQPESFSQPLAATAPSEGASSNRLDMTTASAPLGNSPEEPMVETDQLDREIPAQRSRFNRVIRPVQRLITAMQSLVNESDCLIPGIPMDLFCLQSICPNALVADEYEHPLLAMAASTDPDTLYYHEAMKADDRQHFIHSMQEEVDGQLESGVYTPVTRSSVPKGCTVLPAVWAMRRKRKAKTGEIYRYKSRLNIGGHKQREGVDYDETYAPVVTWPAIRLLLSLTLMQGWYTRQIDYIQAYPQAPVERPMYMEVPKGFVLNNSPGDEQKDIVLQVNKNIYGQKQAGRVWNLYLVDKLLSIGFIQSEHDPCVFFKGKAIYVIYTDDSILAGPDNKELDAIILQMGQSGLKVTSEGDIGDFLGINIVRHEDGSFELTQERLIDSILHDLGLDKPNVSIKSTPAASSKILSKHPSSPAFDNHFHYRSVIGKLNYLEKCSRPDIAYAVHQCARFSADPRFEHGQAIKWLGRYLYGTRDKGIFMKPNGSSLELFVDSDWSGAWDASIADTDSSTARSRHGYVLNYCGCPIFWASQMQTEIALSSTEAEYIGLSRALRETIPMMELLKEMQSHGFLIHSTTAKVHCKVFEDNSGALEMATVHKLRPRTKHINIKYHHFRSHVKDKSISIHPIRSAHNVADMMTKGQPFALLRIHRASIQGWDVTTEKGCENTEVNSSRVLRQTDASTFSHICDSSREGVTNISDDSMEYLNIIPHLNDHPESLSGENTWENTSSATTSSRQTNNQGVAKQSFNGSDRKYFEAKINSKSTLHKKGDRKGF